MALIKLIFCLLLVLKLSKAVQEPLVSPYVDVTLMSEDYLVNIHQATGISSVTLAFALGGIGGCVPSWAGEKEIDNPKIITAIKNFQKIGGKVIVATGGAMGPYLESACSSASLLASAYKKTLQTVGTNHLDIDIEASISLDNMNSALKILQSEMTNVTVSYTLMIQGDDYGLTDFLGVEVLKNAVKHGVKVDVVNAMTMEFGSKLTSWGEAVISAAESVHKQMKQIWTSKSDEELYAMLGVTPMIGRNFNGKVFQLEHAKQLVTWAKTRKVGHLAFWSLGRDNGDCSGGGISPNCSSIAQSEYEFTKIFQEYASTQIPDHFPEKPSPTPVPDTTPGPNKPTDKPHQEKPTDKPKPIDCSVEKYYPHETDCNLYYWCYGGTAHLEHCGAGTVWDPSIKGCNYAKDANRPECK